MALNINQSASITCINPATKKVLGEVKVSRADEIDAAVKAAHQAQRSWQRLSLKERLAIIERFRQILFDSREELARLITSETGKPKVESLIAEIFGVLETCAWLRTHAPKVLAREPVELNALFLPGKRAYNVYEPHGVIAVISPWNYPFSIPVATILSSLTGGNAVVWKPSPKTALIAQAAMDIFRRAGFPENLIQLLQGDKVEAERLILSDVQRVMFTGSTMGGKAIMALAAKKLLPVTLELGGKHAAIVLEDSDIDEIARPLVWAAFTNAGQACASIERLYVARSIKDRLVARLVEHTRALRLGDGLSEETDIGPLIDESQALRVEEQVQDSIARGGRLAIGGKTRFDLGGFFFEPTIIDDAQAGMRIVDEEIFGPVLPVIGVVDEQEAIRLANESSLGLGASVWTQDTEKGERIAREIHAGMVWINDGLYSHIAPDAPWGGVKESGFGRMHSAAELRDLVYVKNIGVNKQQEQVWNYPYTKAAIDYVRGGMELVHGAATEKFAALRKIIDASLRLKR
ncbi:MAG TPA: aldehyde dehydrogenase family protein [Candidatus Obscuribacterales bacterium]